MADWVTLTIELEGCEPIDCRVELRRDRFLSDRNAIYDALRNKLDELGNRAQELIESRGYGRQA